MWIARKSYKIRRAPASSCSFQTIATQSAKVARRSYDRRRRTISFPWRDAGSCLIGNQLAKLVPRGHAGRRLSADMRQEFAFHSTIHINNVLVQEASAHAQVRKPQKLLSAPPHLGATTLASMVQVSAPTATTVWKKTVGTKEARTGSLRETGTLVLVTWGEGKGHSLDRVLCWR